MVGAADVLCGTGPVEVVEEVVEEIAGGMLEADGVVKCTVKVASPPTSLVRFTVMGMAGLWYLRRGRNLRQKCLAIVLVFDLERNGS